MASLANQVEIAAGWDKRTGNEPGRWTFAWLGRRLNPARSRRRCGRFDNCRAEWGVIVHSPVKPRNRVLTALSREQPDRCPMQVSFTPEFAHRLRADMGLDDQDDHNPHGGGNTYQLERALGEDMLLTSVGWANSYYQSNNDYVDEWGVGWSLAAYETPFGTGHYTEIKTHPLADADALSRYHPPDPSRVVPRRGPARPRVRARLLHRRRDRDDHLRDRLGPPRPGADDA